MEIKLVRHEFNEDCTLGKMLINGKFYFFTLEDKDRDLYETDPLSKFKKVKKIGLTCIPYGTYEVVLSYSKKLGRYLPYVMDVKGFTRIRIHNGTSGEWTHGCPLISYSKNKNDNHKLDLSDSKKAEQDLVDILESVHKTEVITLKVIKDGM